MFIEIFWQLPSQTVVIYGIHVLNFLNFAPYKYNHIGIIKTKLKLNIFKQLKHKMKPENPRGKLNWVKINKKCKIQNYN